MTDNQLKGVVQTLATSSNGAFIKEAHKLAKKEESLPPYLS